MPDYGELLKALRIKRGLSQKELARRAGVAQSLISQIENTGATPRLDTWAAIMGALDMAFDHIPEPRKAQPALACSVPWRCLMSPPSNGWPVSLRCWIRCQSS